MKKFGPAEWLFPKPVMIIGTYDKDGKPNAMNADCSGSWDRTEISLFLGKIHQTTLNLQACNEFTLVLANKDTVVGADYVGITSGLREPNKIDKTDWSIEKASDVNAPLFTDFPLTVECRVKEIFDATSADCYHIIAEIVNILVDEKYLGIDGYPDIQKMK